MSPELVEKLLLQFPVAGVVLVALYLAVRYLDRRHVEYLDRLERAVAENREEVRAAADRIERAEGRLDARHAEELDRLKKAHDARVRDLRERIKWLEGRLNPGDRGGIDR